VLVAARLDRDVYDWLKEYGEGYSTRINNILRAVMSRHGSQIRREHRAHVGCAITNLWLKASLL